MIPFKTEWKLNIPTLVGSSIAVSVIVLAQWYNIQNDVKHLQETQKSFEINTRYEIEKLQVRNELVLKQLSDIHREMIGSQARVEAQINILLQRDKNK